MSDEVVVGVADAVVNHMNVEDLIEAIPLESISQWGRALTAASLVAYLYRRLSKTVLDRSKLSYALDSHFALGIDRALITIRAFQRQLATHLESADLLPIASIKSSLHQPLSASEKGDRWRAIRRLSMAHILVSTAMIQSFSMFAVLRSTLFVLLHMRSERRRAAVEASKHKFLSRLKQIGTSGVVPTLLEATMHELGAFAVASHGPFHWDAPDGFGSIAAATEAFLQATPQFVDAALFVVDETLESCRAPSLKEPCESQTLQLLLTIASDSYSRCVPLWKIFHEMLLVIGCGSPSSGGSSQNLQREELVAGPSSRSPSPLTIDDEGSTSATPVTSSLLFRGKHDSAQLKDVTQQLHACINDVLVASDDAIDVVEACAIAKRQCITLDCMTMLENTPAYQDGKRLCITAIGKIDAVRMTVFEPIADVPSAMTAFCRELLKATAKADEANF